VRKGIALIAVLLAAMTLGAKEKDKDKDEKKSSGSHLVDSGTFGIYVGGKRVGTETFRIEQSGDVGTVTADLKVNDGSSRAEQSSEMQVGRDGNLKSYKWHSTLPAKEESTIEPKDSFLVEHVLPADQKKQDVPYILPLSTVILDDNFFSHRELLVWRYLATGCIPKDGLLACNPSQFGVLIPHQHTSGSVVMELLGREKVPMKGGERELNKIKMDADGVQWLLWTEDPENHYKVVKMAVAAINVEVLREPEK
jgi:hypothetical protein